MFFHVKTISDKMALVNVDNISRILEIDDRDAKTLIIFKDGEGKIYSPWDYDTMVTKIQELQ